MTVLWAPDGCTGCVFIAQPGVVLNMGRQVISVPSFSLLHEQGGPGPHVGGKLGGEVVGWMVVKLVHVSGAHLGSPGGTRK